MLKVCTYTGINADVSLDDAQTECEDRARILKFAMINMRFVANMSK